MLDGARLPRRRASYGSTFRLHVKPLSNHHDPPSVVVTANTILCFEHVPPAGLVWREFSAP